MYKDVGKRILALVIAVCLTIVLVNVPGIEVKADSARVYHDYMYGGSGNSGYIKTNTAAAVFQVNQNETQGTEILSSISFDVHAEEETYLAEAGANVSIYAGTVLGEPGSGTFLCSSESYSLVEGTNELPFWASTTKLYYGEYYTVIVTLTGEGLSFYTDTFSESQCTYIKEANGSWKDMGDAGRSVSIRATTYDEGILEPVKESVIEWIADVMSSLAPAEKTDAAVSEIGTEAVMENGSIGDEPAEKRDLYEDTKAQEEDAADVLDSGMSETEAPGSDIMPIADDDISSGGTNDVELNQTDIILAKDHTFTLRVASPQTGRSYKWSITSTNGDSYIAFVAGEGTTTTMNGNSVTVIAHTVPSRDDTIIQVQVAEYEGVILRKTGNCNIKVIEKYVDLALDDIDDVIYTGTEQKAPVTVRDADTGSVINKKDAFEAIYEGDLVNAGEVSVTIIGNELAGYNESRPVKTYHILPKALEESFVDGDIPVGSSDDLTEEMIAEEINRTRRIVYKVSNSDGTEDSEETVTENVLEYGRDYTLTNWEENFAEGGRHSVTLVAAENSNYSGSIEITYIILRSVANEYHADILVEEGNFNKGFTYTGDVIQPGVTVRYDGVPLIEGTDYEIEYSGSTTEAGTGTIKITGIGDYCGEAEKEFQIVPKYITNYDKTEYSVTMVPTEFLTVARPETEEAAIPLPEFKMYYRDKELIEGTDYEISNVVLKDGTNLLDTTEAEFTIKGLANFIGEDTLSYRIGDDIQKYIDENGLTIRLGIDDPYTYTGQEVSLESVIIGDLVQGKDFIVECHAKNVGTAEVYIHGTGKYGGTYHIDGDPLNPSATFTIQARDLGAMDDSCFVLEKRKVEYAKDPEKMKPGVTIIYQGQAIDPEEYELEYEADEALAVGTGHIIKVKAKGDNLSGEKELTYEITKVTLTDGEGGNTTVNISPDDYRYIGSPIDVTGNITVICNGEELEYGVDYELEYVTDGEDEAEYKTNCGTKYVEIHGIGNYGGIVEESYVVSKIPLNELTIEMDQLDADASEYVKQLLGGTTGYRAYLRYDGNAKEPEVVLNFCDEEGNVITTLSPDRDYTVAYENNTKMSKEGEPAYLTIKSRNTDKAVCVGDMIIPFLIYKEIDSTEIEGIPDNITYTGKEITFDETVSIKTEERDGIFSTTVTELELDTDYFITYEGDTINAGTGRTVTIHGRQKADLLTPNGCYVIDYSKQFTIDKRALRTVTYDKFSKQYNNEAVTLTADDFTRANLGFYPEEDEDGNGIGERVLLVYDKDFEIVEGSYNGNESVANNASASVQITAKDPGNFTGTMRINFSILGKSIMDVEVTAEPLIYSGLETNPKLTVTDGDYVLEEGEDYEIVREEGVSFIDAGEAYVYIVGINNYEGEEGEKRKIEYEILPLDISNEAALGQVTLDGMEDEYTYEYGGVVPVPANVFFRPNGAQGDLRLGKDKDYEILPYVANENIGKAMIQIQGTGNFSGVYTQSFQIIPKAIAIESTDEEGNSVVIENEGIVIEDIPTQEFFESYATYVTPDVTIRHGNYKLVKDLDYTLTYKNNFGVTGRPATVTITGIGNYAGPISIDKQFSIVNSMSDGGSIKITYEDPSDEYVYTGEEIRPKVTVRNAMTGAKLVEGTDYIIKPAEGYDNINVGEAKMIIAGTGKYAGEIPHEFTIVPRSINDEAVEMVLTDGEEYEYTGESIAPGVTVTYNGELLTEGKDYEIIREIQYTNVGETGKVVIKGINNFGTGETREVMFHIVPKSIGSNTTFAEGFNAVVQDQYYIGISIEPQPVVTYGSKVLEEGKDYTLSDYSNNDDIGVATYQINGINNFTGSVTRTFAIKGHINSGTVTIELPETTYEAIVNEAGTQLVAIEPELKVVYHYEDGREKELSVETDYTLSYRDNDKVGEASVSVNGKDLYEGTVSTTFVITGDLKDAVVAEIPPQPYDDGEIITPEVVISYFGQDLRPGIDYECVSSSTEITPTGSMETLTINGKGYFEGTSTTAEFRIVEAVGLTVSIVNPQGYTYTGKQIIPEIKVKYDGDLLDSSQYDIEYGENINAGSLAGSVRVRYPAGGQTPDREIVEKQFTINPFDISQSGVDVKDSVTGEYGCIRDMEYLGGRPIIPNNFEIVYQENGQDILRFVNTLFDVTLVEGDNVNPGTVRISIEPNSENSGNFIGTKETTFNIVPRNLENTTIMAVQQEYTYSGDVVLPEIIILNFSSAQKGVDYNVIVDAEGDNINAGTRTAIVVGMGSYYTGSQTVEYTISPLGMNSANITIEEIPEQDYTGEGVCPDSSIVVKYRGSVLSAGEDYNVTYENNINAGVDTAVARISGAGNFTNSATKNFTINRADISSEAFILEPIPSGIFTGAPVNANITLKFGDKRLAEGTDYSIEYEGAHTELGIVSLTITGKGNYTGTRTGSFRIVADSIENAVVEGIEESYVYTGSSICPENGIVVRIGTTVLTKDTDYTISYGENTNVGQGTVIIAGQGDSYGGTKTITFEITQKPITDTDVIMEGFKASMPYTGEQAVQSIELTYNGHVLTEGTDYVLECTNNNTVTEEALMTVSGIGNYTGRISQTYAITAATLDDAEISNVSSTYTYSGEEIIPIPVVTIGDVELEKDVDYTVTLTNNLNAGTATLTITGINNYRGSERELNFTITSKSIQRASFSAIEEQIYNGEEVRPKVIVTDGGKVLEEGVSYSLSYMNNQKAGTATANIVGRGNYQGAKYIQFEIIVGAITTASAIGWTDSSVSLSWSGEGTVTGYEIYRNDGSGQYQMIARTARKTYTDTELTSGQTYSYRIRAYHLASGSEPVYGDLSPVVEVTTL